MRIEMEPVGYVRNEVRCRKDDSWGEGISAVVLDEAYRTGLAGR